MTDSTLKGTNAPGRESEGVEIREPPEDSGVQQIPFKGEYSETAWDGRVFWVQERTGQRLEETLKTSLDPEGLRGNIENFIGAVQIPIGVAGPLLVQGEQARGWFLAPFATTEGALVASVSRGTQACSQSGGVRTHVIWHQMVRAPLFQFRDLGSTVAFTEWITDHIDDLRKQIGKVSRRATLLKVEPYLMGNMVHVRFCFKTGDAAGQNMTTLCTWIACQWILDELKKKPEMELERYLIEGNMSGDKKIAYQSYLSGRGVRVTAECFLPRSVVRKVLKTTPEAMAEGNLCGMVGATQAGMMGYNINFANVIAAVFTATGQDIACVHESSVGQIHVQARKDGLYASVLLPNLVIGTLGGGTRLPAQRECLQIMGCYGPNRINKFAEILGALCLALDLSTMSAVAADHFATAHRRLGRPQPLKKTFQKKDLNEAFFENALRGWGKKPFRKVVSVKPLEEVSDSSILSKLTLDQTQKLIGLFPYQITCEEEGKGTFRERLMVKVKPKDKDVLTMGRGMVRLSGSERLLQLYNFFNKNIEFYGCHLRELAIYGLQAPGLRKYFPEILDIQEDDEKEFYCIVMEYLGGLSHLDSENDPSLWKDEDIKLALKGMAEVHSIHFNQPLSALKSLHLVVPTQETVQGMRDFWREMTDVNNFMHPDLITEERWRMLHRFIDARPEDWQRIEEHPRTLVHNDFNPRNLCFRETEEGRRLCLYDWELATYHVPQRDLAEFLAYVFPEGTGKDRYDYFVDVYRSELERYTEQALDPEAFLEMFRIAMKDLAVTRMNLYLMAHNFKQYSFLNRVYPNIMEFLEKAC